MKAIRLCLENAKAVENAVGRLPYDRKTLRILTAPTYLIIDPSLSVDYLVVSQKRFMKTYKMPKTETALGFFEVVKR